MKGILAVSAKVKVILKVTSQKLRGSLLLLFYAVLCCLVNVAAAVELSCISVLFYCVVCLCCILHLLRGAIVYIVV